MIELIENNKISLTAVALKSGTVGGSAGHPPSFWDWTNEQYETSKAEKIVNWIMVSVWLEFLIILYYKEHLCTSFICKLNSYTNVSRLMVWHLGKIPKNYSQ